MDQYIYFNNMGDILMSDLHFCIFEALKIIDT